MLKEKLGHTLNVFSIAMISTVFLTQIPYSPNVGAASVSRDVTFNVGIKEYLSMSVTAPSSSPTADIDQFMCNTVGLQAITNNTSGLVVGMTSSTTSTALSNAGSTAASRTIPTLTSSSNYSTSSFPADYWGYYASASNVTTCGTSTYYGVPASNATPGQVLSGSSAGTYTGNVHFGAKASSSKASGAYVGTVIFSAISGQNTINSNPVDPVTPVTPEQTAATTTSGGASSGTATAYTYTTGGSTTTTQVSDGDNTGAYSGYSGYTTPQGVSEKESTVTATEVDNGNPLVTGLAVAATAAAASGTFFFILAKRKKDDDDEEEGPEKDF